MTARPMTALLGVLVVVAIGIPRTTNAQDRRVYVGGAGMLSHVSSHRQGSSPSLPTTGAGGTAIGLTVEAGRFLTPRLAVGIEVSAPRCFTATQEIDYSRVFQLESHHRDLAISGLFRARVTSSRRARFDIVGGGGLVQERTRQRRRDQIGLLPTFPPVFGPYSEAYAFTRETVSLLAGADLEIAIRSGVAIVPQLRAHFIRRSLDPSEPGWVLGLSSVVLRPAIGMRVAF